MSLEARKFDNTSPLRPGGVRPFKLPAEWTVEEGDLFSGLVASGAMVSGVGLLFKRPMLAFAGFFFAVAHWAHDKPYSRSKENGSSPAISLLFASLAIVSALVPKMIVLPEQL